MIDIIEYGILKILFSAIMYSNFLNQNYGYIQFMKIMHFLLPLALTVGLSIPSYAQSRKTPNRSNILEGIAIVVNSDIITFAEWRQALAEARGQVQATDTTTFENEVMNMLVIERLQNQIAERNNIKINNEDIDSAIAEIAKRNNVTVDMLVNYLKQSGQNIESYRDSIRKQMVAARVRDGVMQRVRVTNHDVDLFMLSAEFQQALKQLPTAKLKQTRASHILVRVNKDLTDPQAKLRAQRLYERISGGEDFELLARAQSDDPVSSAKGGNLGWVFEGQLTPEFEKAMDNLPLNTLSQIVRTPFGYHIIKVHERKEGPQSDEMIRNMAREMLYRKKATQAWAIWQDNLLSQAFIEKRF